jgi:four helix bundle protein
MGDFKKLDVWQAAHALACEVYKTTQPFPKSEVYGLTSQLRRSAASIAANIVEGCRRNGDVEFGRFVRISLGSATELEYHLLLSRDIGLLDDATHARLSAEARRIQGTLAGLKRALKGSDPIKRQLPIANNPWLNNRAARSPRRNCGPPAHWLFRSRRIHFSVLLLLATA